MTDQDANNNTLPLRENLVSSRRVQLDAKFSCNQHAKTVTSISNLLILNVKIMRAYSERGCVTLINVFTLKVKTAVQFLQNPKVLLSPSSQKQQFLRRKGLTDEEIKTAFKLAAVDNTTERDLVFHNQNPYTTVQIPQGSAYPYYQTTVYQPTILQKVKEFFNVTALVGATAYCVYLLYKVLYRIVQGKFNHARMF